MHFIGMASPVASASGSAQYRGDAEDDTEFCFETLLISIHFQYLAFTFVAHPAEFPSHFRPQFKPS